MHQPKKPERPVWLAAGVVVLTFLVLQSLGGTKEVVTRISSGPTGNLAAPLDPTGVAAASIVPSVDAVPYIHPSSMSPGARQHGACTGFSTAAWLYVPQAGLQKQQQQSSAPNTTLLPPILPVPWAFPASCRPTKGPYTGSGPSQRLRLVQDVHSAGRYAAPLLALPGQPVR